jgi:hypothetical protein
VFPIRIVATAAIDIVASNFGLIMAKALGLKHVIKS